MGFGFDICHCESSECEKWNECYRGKYANVFDTDECYTTSFLSNVCNKDNGYKDYVELYPIEKEILKKCDR